MNTSFSNLFNSTNSTSIPFNNTNNTFTKPREDHTFFLVRNVLIGIVGTLLNLLAIILLSIAKKLRTSIKITLLSLSVNDMLFMMSTIAYGIPQWMHSADNPICRPVVYFIVTSLVMSSITTCLLAVHNYIAVFLPLRLNMIASTYRTGLAVAGSWVLGCLLGFASIGLSFPPGIKCFTVAAISVQGIFTVGFVSFICIISIIILNTKIFVKIWRRRCVVNVVRGDCGRTSGRRDQLEICDSCHAGSSLRPPFPSPVCRPMVTMRVPLEESLKTGRHSSSSNHSWSEDSQVNCHNTFKYNKWQKWRVSETTNMPAFPGSVAGRTHQLIRRQLNSHNDVESLQPRTANLSLISSGALSERVGSETACPRRAVNEQTEGPGVTFSGSKKPFRKLFKIPESSLSASHQVNTATLDAANRHRLSSEGPELVRMPAKWHRDSHSETPVTSAEQRSPCTMTRRQKSNVTVSRNRMRIHYTLIILTAWSCLLTLPYVMYMIYVPTQTADAKSKEKFVNSRLGVILSSLLGLNACTNPLLYAWRFIDWRNVFQKMRQALRWRCLN